MCVSTPTFRVEAIPADVLGRIRARGVDDLGNKVTEMIDEVGGSPLRCCLRDAAPGERIAAIGYDPFPWHGPYAEVGPVFIHADSCAGHQRGRGYPAGFRRREQIFRAYGLDRTIVEAVIVDGANAETALATMLERPEIDFVHSRNVAYGCYMFTIRRD